MTGQKINWWESDLRSAPMNYSSNIDFYGKLRWDADSRKMGNPGPFGAPQQAMTTNGWQAANAPMGGTTKNHGSSQASASSQKGKKASKKNKSKKSAKNKADNSREENFYPEQQAVNNQAYPGQPQIYPNQQQPYGNNPQAFQQQAMMQQQGAGVQSTPVIQPFVVVPYSTPMQPILHNSDGTIPIGDFDSNYVQAHGMPQQPMMGGMQPNPMMGMDGIYYNMDEEETGKKKERKVKKVRTTSAASFIIMILIALFATVTLFIKPLLGLISIDMETAFVTWNAGEITLFSSFNYMLDAVSSGEFDFSNTLFIVRGLLVIGSILLGLEFLTALFTVGRKGTPVFGKIVAFLAFVAIAVSVVLCMLNNDYTLGITAYILAGIALLVFLVSLFGPGKSNKKRRGF